MSNGRVEAVNRNTLDVSASVIKTKGVIIGVVLFLFVICAIASFYFFTRKNETPQTGLDKNPVNNESLQSASTSNSSLDSMKQTILEKENSAKRIAEKNRIEEEKKRKAAQEQEALKGNNDQAGQGQQGQSQGFRSDTQQSDHKDKPLSKAQRVLVGNSLVNFESRQADKEKSPEKDFLQGGDYADGSVTPVIKRRFLLSAGTSLSCILKTKIITSYPAITLCQMARDVYSDDGKTLLVRKGAMLMGEQKKAIVQGVARVFVTWTSIKDGNIKVRVDALGTDGLGAAGLPAWIDTHFWERFGNSLLLTLIGDTLDSAKNLTQSNSGNQGNITYENTSEGIQQQASIALQNSINIAPTGYINQGTVISVLVPRNVDFSSVYEVN